MELFEYIKSQLPQMPNSAIMKQLGASQELIDYVKETPENTNLRVMETLESGKIVLWTANGLLGEEQVSGNLPNNNNPNYPIGRYVWDYNYDEEDYETRMWIYMGEPTGIINGDALEIYSDNDTLKARATSATCDFWDNNEIDTDTKNVEVYAPMCI